MQEISFRDFKKSSGWRGIVLLAWNLKLHADGITIVGNTVSVILYDCRIDGRSTSFTCMESGCFSSTWHIFIHFDSEDAMRNMRLNYKSLCAIIASPDDTQ
ncbi:uncharacterized protein LOC116414336 [Apis florea]|uniref:uncharacterized protein LOC116414336 n=1 Tax=Apis florea TaxID=7463 RepID=UPI0012FE8715|nr:uncharacterized protein LOC116414336 [Apis florea]